VGSVTLSTAEASLIPPTFEGFRSHMRFSSSLT
jgi:hypothetical protein